MDGVLVQFFAPGEGGASNVTLLSLDLTCGPFAFTGSEPPQAVKNNTIMARAAKSFIIAPNG